MRNSNISLGPKNQVNENKVRVTAIWVLASALSYLATNAFYIPLLLALDFGLRGVNLGKFSPFGLLSEWVVLRFNLGVKPIFYPPKRFAARIGFFLSLLIAVLHPVALPAAVFLSGVLAFFAALESIGGVCVGCYVYDWLQKLKKNN